MSYRAQIKPTRHSRPIWRSLNRYPSKEAARHVAETTRALLLPVVLSTAAGRPRPGIAVDPRSLRMGEQNLAGRGRIDWDGPVRILWWPLRPSFPPADNAGALALAQRIINGAICTWGHG